VRAPRPHSTMLAPVAATLTLVKAWLSAVVAKSERTARHGPSKPRATGRVDVLKLRCDPGSWGDTVFEANRQALLRALLRRYTSFMRF